jgi:molecular chaperone HscC
MLVGIDLGTTNSLISVFRNGQTELIPNALGHVLTPSAVSLDAADNFLVGLPARERVTTHAQHTATAFKRWMGTDKKIRLGKRELRAEELSALVLKSLKADAESYLGEPVTEAVITVPAYFNEAQRKATKAAGELAGLKVERLLNEPTAAGLAYGLQERTDHTTFLVFDLGGGTFDVSVLEYFEGVVEVRSSAGDTQLGGEDFVNALADLFLSRCTELSTREKEEIAQARSLWRIAEQAKRDLSDHEAATMRLTRGSAVFEHTITRNDFEQACTELLARLRRPIERALLDARLAPGALSEVVLVGGATRMPMVRQTVTRLFQRLPLRTINPDETIARGAAIQAALKARDAALSEIVLTDVMPYSLGVITTEMIGNRRMADRFSPIIERNTPVPVSRVSNYCTIEDNQKFLKLDIRQGESPIGSENLKLGELELEVPPLPAGHATVDVRFSYDANGLLAVDAKETSSGRAVSVVIEQTGTVMTQEQIAQALKRLEALKVHPREQQENIYLLERAKRLYEDRLSEERQWIAAALARFETALDTQDERTVRAARDELRGTLDQFDRGFVL